MTNDVHSLSKCNKHEAIIYPGTDLPRGFAGSAEVLRAWGSFGHQHINHAAVFALPEPMRPFFYNHIDFITEESVIPDLRKYTLNDKSENPRHYIDIEGFEPVPFDSLPKTMKEAASKYDEKIPSEDGYPSLVYPGCDG